MTQQHRDKLTEWLTDRFPILSQNDVYLIVMHVEHYFAPEIGKMGEIYDDESPDQIKQSIEEI